MCPTTSCQLPSAEGLSAPWFLCKLLLERGAAGEREREKEGPERESGWFM